MVSSRSIFGVVALIVSNVLAQSAAYTDQGIDFNGMTDPTYDVTYGFVTPPTTATGAEAQEFIGEIVSPLSNEWVGIALGGQMADNLLLVAWPNGDEIVFSPRYTTGYIQPLPYTGPTITTLYSNVNSTTWTWIYRCQNCTTWESGSLDTTGTPVMAWAISLTPVFTPSDPDTDFNEHDDFDFWGEELVNASSDNYESYVAGDFGGGTPTTPISSISSPTSSHSVTISTPSTAPTVAATPYDYIVVGGGVGGLIAGNRLAEAGHKVMLLERGGPSTGETGGTDVPPWANGTTLTRYDIPGEFQGLFGSTGDTYWFCEDVLTFAGCVVGGGSSVNGGLYWYPNSMDFSTERGWPASWGNYTSFLETVQGVLPSTDNPSTDGIRYLEQVFPVMQSMLSPLGFSNITINDNPSSKDHVYGYSSYNFQEGKRWGPVATYFRTAKTLPNFSYAYYSYVTSVARNGSVVTGVQTNNTLLGPNGFIPLTKNGRVILSGGSFGTPRVLFNSGIGPSDMISLVQSNPAQVNQLPPSSDFIDLPVGMNVQDNPSIDLVFTHPTIDDYDNWDDIWSTYINADTSQYLKSQSGVYANSSPRVNFWRAYEGSDNITRYMQGTVRPGFDFTETNYTYNASAAFSITVYLSTGITSRGRVGLVDDAGTMGIITDPWFTDPIDKEVLISGINELLTGAAQVKGLDLITPDNTTTITDYVNNYAPSSLCSNHWVSANQIGQVVDTNTKVMNMTNLFIVDASIIPALPTGNPQGTLMVAAEMAISRILALAGGP